MNNQVVLTEKKWYQSSNFYLTAILVIGGFFIGFPEGAANELVGGLFATIGSAGILRNFFKTGTFNKEHFKDVNFWNQLAAVAVSIFPLLPPEMFGYLQQIVDAAMTQNWQGLMIAAFSLATMLYKIFKPTPTKA